MYKQSRNPRAVRVCTPKDNDELVNKALDEISTAQKSYDDTIALGDETVAQTLMRYMNKRKWYPSTFEIMTGLDLGHYSRIKTKPNRRFDLNILVSICVGLDLPYGKSIEIIERAGYKLIPQILEHALYNHILSTVGMRNIYACNRFLETLAKRNNEKVRLLGSGDYCSGSSKEDADNE